MSLRESPGQALASEGRGRRADEEEGYPPHGRDCSTTARFREPRGMTLLFAETARGWRPVAGAFDREAGAAVSLGRRGRSAG